jgi:hypothetical protein
VGRSSGLPGKLPGCTCACMDHEDLGTHLQGDAAAAALAKPGLDLPTPAT